jgi:nickel-type superoxide dismutase maturation protease
MLPALQPGQVVVATPWVRLRPGKVIIAINPGGREVIKRVKSVTGGGIVVEGDNPAASTDSRTFGPIDPRKVRGVVIYPYNL